MGPHGAPMGPHGAPMAPLGPHGPPGPHSGPDGGPARTFFVFFADFGLEAQKRPEKKVLPRPNHYHGCIWGESLIPGVVSVLDLTS